MTGFDTAAELQVGLSDVARTREFLRLFARAWALPDGCHALERFEAPLEVALPVALRETYGLGGVLDPGALEVQDNVLVFHCADPMITESMWGIPLDFVGQPDPPVVINTGDGVWQPYLDRVSLACVDLALTEDPLGAWRPGRRRTPAMAAISRSSRSACTATQAKTPTTSIVRSSSTAICPAEGPGRALRRRGRPAPRIDRDRGRRHLS